MVSIPIICFAKTDEFLPDSEIIACNSTIACNNLRIWQELVLQPDQDDWYREDDCFCIIIQNREPVSGYLYK